MINGNYLQNRLIFQIILNIHKINISMIIIFTLKINYFAKFNIFCILKVLLSMEEENNNQYIIEDKEIITKLQLTYSGGTTDQIREAELWLLQKASNEEFLKQLLKFITPPTTFDNSFQLSTSIMINKIFYQLAETSKDKSGYIRDLYGMLNLKSIPIKVKEQLGTSIQHILNKDSNNLYKSQLMSKLHQDLKQQKNIESLNGLMIVNMACFNSIIEIQHIVEYFNKLINILSANVQYLLSEVQKNQQDLLIFISTISKLFQFLEIAIQRIIEQEELIEEQVKGIRSNERLRLMFEDLLKAFSKGNSIISADCPLLNPVKKSVIESLFLLYRFQMFPPSLLGMVYGTIIEQSQNQQENTDQIEQIIVRSLQILENQVGEKHYLGFFSTHKVQIIFALLMYSITTPDQHSQMIDNPAKFSEIAQEFSEAYSSSPIIKVRAACLIKALSNFIDEIPRNILQVLIITITSSLPQSSINSQAISNVCEVFSQFKFSRMPVSTKIETSFIALTIIAPIINKRQDLCNVVYAMLITNLQSFSKITDPLLIARLIRLVGYYPSAIYFTFVHLRMSVNKSCTVEALKMFDRILRTNQFSEIYELLGQICYDLLDIMDITDSISQSLILNNYQKIIRTNNKLFLKTIKKLGLIFRQNYVSTNQKAFVSLSFLTSLNTLQKQPQYRKIIVEELFQVIGCCDGYCQYDEKVIEIYLSFVQLSPIIEQKIEEFTKKSLQRLTDYGNNSLIYKFYNEFFMKLARNKDKIVEIAFKTFMKHLIQNNVRQKSTSIPHLCFLMGQIVITFKDLKFLDQQDVFNLLEMAQKMNGDSRMQIISLILQILYSQPVKIRQLLMRKNIYEQALKFLLVQKYQGKFMRKVFVLGMTRLLQVQQKFFKDIIMVCLENLKLQNDQNHVRITKNKITDIKLRKAPLLKNQSDEEEKIQQSSIPSNNYWDSYFVSFKHPIYSLSEYEHFKIKVWQNSDYIDSFSNQEKAELKKVMETDWWHGKTRVIVKVKR